VAGADTMPCTMHSAGYPVCRPRRGRPCVKSGWLVGMVPPTTEGAVRWPARDRPWCRRQRPGSRISWCASRSGRLEDWTIGARRDLPWRLLVGMTGGTGFPNRRYHDAGNISRALRRSTMSRRAFGREHDGAAPNFRSFARIHRAIFRKPPALSKPRRSRPAARQPRGSNRGRPRQAATMSATGDL
jgi:hypothetical protein